MYRFMDKEEIEIRQMDSLKMLHLYKLGGSDAIAAYYGDNQQINMCAMDKHYDLLMERVLTLYSQCEDKNSIIVDEAAKKLLEAATCRGENYTRDHGDFIPELNLLLELDGEIIASVKYLKSILKDETGYKKGIISFGPLCVSPKYQRQGYGKALLEYSFDVAKDMGYDVIVNFGDPANYAARGFKSCHKFNVCLEGDVYHSSLLVKELVPDALDGRKWYYYESSAFQGITPEDVEEFDKTFPAMEKAWRPSQEIFYIQCRSTMGN